MRSLRRELAGLFAIVVTFAALAAGHAVRTPMFEGPDEDSNLEYVRFLDVEGRLAQPSVEPTPELEALERGILPPLWFLQTLPLYRGLGLSGVTATPVMNGGFLRDPQFQAEISAQELSLEEALARPGARNRYLHGLDESPDALPDSPGAAAVGSLRWLRLATVPWGVLALICAHGAVRRALGRGRRALWFTAALAFTPQLQFLSGNLSMDAMLAAWGCLAIWAMVEWNAGAEHRARRWALVAGIAVGLAALTKLNGLVLVPVLLLSGFLARHRGPRPGQAFVLALVGLVLVSGPYYVWGWIEAGHPLWMWAYQDASPLHNLAGHAPAVWDLRGIWNYHLVLFLTWFGDIAWTSVWFEPGISYPALALYVGGLVVGIARLRGERGEALIGEPRAAARALLLTGAILMLAAELWFNLRFSQPQGRHLYPFLVAVAFPVLYGLERLHLLKPVVLASFVLSLAAFPLLVDKLRPPGWNTEPWVAVTDAGRSATPTPGELDVPWLLVEPATPERGPALAWQARAGHSYELLLSVGDESFEDRPWSTTSGLLRSARVFRRALGGDAILPVEFWQALPEGAEAWFLVLEYDRRGATTGRSVVRRLTR